MDETKENYTQSFCLKEESIDEPVMKWESKLKKKLSWETKNIYRTIKQ